MTNHAIRAVLAAVFLCCAGLPDLLAAVETEKPSIVTIKIDKPFALTGRLDHPAWSRAVPVELRYEVDPGDNTPAPQKTLVWSLHDDKFLYFGFRCFDTHPEAIRANVSDRDRMYQDDWVFVSIDTYGDYQRSYEFCVNPFGIQGDLLATSNSEDASIDWIWYSAADRNAEGWTAEMAIPFASLNFPSADTQNWRINILRTVPRESRTQISWMRFDKNISGIMSQAGYLQGLKEISSGGKLELLPYAIGQKSGSLTDVELPNSGFAWDPVETRFGGSVKYAPTPDLTIDGVINPDFSQIETDAAQISVNTTFALQYEEKRPFFLIGRELLETPMYYSRSINDPIGAGRVMGKAGSLSYLYMSAFDRNTIFDIPGEERSYTLGTEEKSFVNIGRLRYDLGDESYVGGMFLGRNMSDGHNYVAGLDWSAKFWSNWYFSGEGFLSRTKELNDTTLLDSQREFGRTGNNAAFNGENYGGLGLHVNLSHSEKTYNFGLTFNRFSPTYQAYNGSFSQNNFQQMYMNHSFTAYPESSFVVRASAGFNSNLQFDYYGMKKEQVIQPYVSMTMKGQTNLYAQYLVVNDEHFGGRWFRGIHRTYAELSTRPMNEISIYVWGQFGRFIRRSSDPGIGTGHNLGASVTLKPGSKWNLSFSYDRARLSDRESGELFYDGNIYRTVLIYQHSSEMFFRTIFQYDSFGQGLQIYPLFSYKLNAFTTFFAGATSNYLRYNEDEGFANTDQQYFIKLQYLLAI